MNTDFLNSGDIYGKHATGRDVDELVMAVLDGAGDLEEKTRDSMIAALIKIGQKEPMLVLVSCVRQLAKQDKLQRDHRIAVLIVMTQLIRDTNPFHSLDVLQACILAATAELTGSKDIIPEWQTPASNVLVAAGVHDCPAVMNNILDLFKIDQLPHYFILHTVANLASENKFGFVRFLQPVLEKLLPNLGTIRHDNIKYVCAYAFGKFAEALIDYLANLDRAPDSSVNRGDFLPSFNTAFDVLARWLVNAKEAKLRAALMESLGYVSLLTSREKIESHLAPLISNHLLPAMKRQNEFTFPATQCLAMLIDSCHQHGSIVIGTLADAIMSTMLVQLSEFADFSNPLALKTHNEMLRCFTLICFTDPQVTVNFLLARLEPKLGSDGKMKARVLSVLRHLVNTADTEIGERKPTLMVSLREVVNDQDESVARALLQLIVSMADHGYFELEGSRILIEYVVRQCTLCQPKGAKPNGKQGFQGIANLAGSVLNLLTTTLPQVENALWPSLLEYLLPARYSGAFGNVCRALAHIAQRRLENHNNQRANGGSHHLTNGNDDTTSIINGVNPFDNSMMINFSDLPNLPKPVEIFARCILMAADETELLTTNSQIIKFMEVFAPNFFSNLNEVTASDWTASLGICNSLIESDPATRSKDFPKDWEAALVKLLLAAIDTVQGVDPEWTAELCRAFFAQLESYRLYPRSRCLFHMMIAGCLSRSVKRDFIQNTIEQWFSVVDHLNPEEQQSFATGCGFAATTQLDVVLSKIEAGLKGQPLTMSANVNGSGSGGSGGKSETKSGFVSFFQSLTKSDTSNLSATVKSTLILAMGNAISAAPPSLSVSRVESVVVPHLITTANASTKPALDSAMRLSLLLCVETVARSLHPDVTGRLATLAKRDELISSVCRKFVNEESSSNVASEVRLAGIKAAKSLLELDPVLAEPALEQLVTTLIQSVFQLPESAAFEVKFLHTMDALVECLITIFVKFQQPLSGVAFLMKYLSDDKWLQSPNDFYRERASLAISKLLAKFQERIVSGAFISSIGDQQNSFVIVSNLFAVIIPRLADSSQQVRESASPSLISCLKVVSHLSGKEVDLVSDGVPSMQERIQGGEPNSLHSAILDVAKNLSKLLPDIKPLVNVLNLSDCQPHGSSASCLVLHTLIKQRSNEMVDMIPNLYDRFLTELSKLIDPQTDKKNNKDNKQTVDITKLINPNPNGPVQTGILRCCRLLAVNQTGPTLNALLSIHYPYPESVSVMWRYLAQDNQLGGSILDVFLENLARCVPYEEPRKRPVTTPGGDSNYGHQAQGRIRTIRMANIQPLLMISAMGDMFQVPEMEGKLLVNYHQILATLILMVSAYSGAKEPSKEQQVTMASSNRMSSKLVANLKIPTPVSQVLLALNNFLMSSASMDVRQNIDEVWPDFAKDDSVLEAIARLAGELGRTRPKQMPKIANILLPHFTSPYDTYRSAVAVCLAEFIAQQPEGDQDGNNLIETLIASIQGHLTDQCFDVRLYCYRGMGNLGSKSETLVSHHATSLVNSLLLGLEDRDDPNGELGIESLQALSKLLKKCSEQVVRPIFVNIVVRVKVCFDNENAKIRQESIKLFGELTRFATGPSEVTVWEQSHLALVPIWVHLNDSDPDVSLASAAAMVSLGNVLGAVAVVQLFQKALGPLCQQRSTRSLHFVEFSSSAAATLAEYFADRMFSYYTQFLTGYFVNQKWQLRANAVTILGFLLSNLPVDKHSSVGKHHLCTQLITMLKDQSPEVRCRAAEAIGLLALY